MLLFCYHCECINCGFFQWIETATLIAWVLWTRLCAMPVYPQGGIGNCTVTQMHSFAEEFFNAQFVVRNGSAELAETGNVPTRQSQIKAKCIYCFIFTVQIYFVLKLRVHPPPDLSIVKFFSYKCRIHNCF